MEYKKSYKGLVLWLLGLAVAMFSPMLLPIRDEDLMARLMLNLTSAGMAALMVVILRTESVYWINGVTFEQARDAGGERRRAFAAAHLKRFCAFALGFAVLSAVAQARGISLFWDVFFFCAGLTAAALTTIRIRL